MAFLQMLLNSKIVVEEFISVREKENPLHCQVLLDLWKLEWVQGTG
jgi:hypothetical protein